MTFMSKILRISAILLQPICPNIAGELLDHVSSVDRTVAAAKVGVLNGEPLGVRRKPLIPRCNISYIPNALDKD